MDKGLITGKCNQTFVSFRGGYFYRSIYIAFIDYKKVVSFEGGGDKELRL